MSLFANFPFWIRKLIIKGQNRIHKIVSIVNPINPQGLMPQMQIKLIDSIACEKNNMLFVSIASFFLFGAIARVDDIEVLKWILVFLYVPVSFIRLWQIDAHQKMRLEKRVLRSDKLEMTYVATILSQIMLNSIMIIIVMMYGSNDARWMATAFIGAAASIGVLRNAYLKKLAIVLSIMLLSPLAVGWFVIGEGLYRLTGVFSFAYMILLAMTIIREHNAVIDVQEQIQEAVRFASHDDLTGLPNRVTFMKRVNDMLKQHRKTSILMIDLDLFKEVNDTYGHEAGDVVLRTVSVRMKMIVDDYSSKQNALTVAARFGGDEFLIATQFQNPSSIAAEVIDLISHPIPYKGHELCVGASIGIADNSKVNSLITIIHHADTALYLSKAAGRNRDTVYDPSMDVLSRHQASKQTYEKYEEYHEPMTRTG